MAKAWDSNKIAELIRGKIVKNTLSSIDAKGEDFPKYSIPYLLLRKKKNRDVKPNLWFTGSMLKSFTVLEAIDEKFSGSEGNIEVNVGGNKQIIRLPFPKRSHIKLGWTDPLQSDKAYWNMKKGRNMFGLKKLDLENIVREFTE